MSEDKDKDKTTPLSLTVIVKHYDDGTTTQTFADEVPTVIKTMEQFEAYEDCLKQVHLRDSLGDYWMYRNGRWVWKFSETTHGGTWHTYTDRVMIKANLPMTVVKDVGD